jgi:hypothetical protein
MKARARCSNPRILLPLWSLLLRGVRLLKQLQPRVQVPTLLRLVVMLLCVTLRLPRLPLPLPHLLLSSPLMPPRQPLRLILAAPLPRSRPPRLRPLLWLEWRCSPLWSPSPRSHPVQTRPRSHPIRLSRLSRKSLPERPERAPPGPPAIRLPHLAALLSTFNYSWPNWPFFCWCFLPLNHHFTP